MRRWLGFILSIVMGVTIMPVSAQNAAQEQSALFALQEGTLLSYTLDGTTNRLMENVNWDGLRLFKTASPDTALMVAEVEIEGNIGLYRVPVADTPRPLALPPDYKLDSTNWFKGAEHHPYYLLHAITKLPEALGLLVNLDTLEAQPLTNTVFYNSQPAAAFSADGSKLRYLSKAADVPDTWYLLERDLASGDERTIYTFNEFYPNISYDTTGERWLYRTTNRDTRIATTVLIKPDGSVTDIAQDDNGAYHLRIIWNDQLYVTPAVCQADCPIKLAPLNAADDQAGLTFTVPVIQTLPVPLAMPDAAHIVVSDQGTFWRLGTDHSAANLGTFNAATILTPRVLSPDERWLLALAAGDDGEFTGYNVWDLQTGQAVVQSELPQAINITFDDEGIILWEYQDTQKVYRFSDQQLFTLDIGRRETVRTLANDQTAIVSASKGSKIGAPGIYAYDLDTQTYRLLVADAQALFIG